MFAVRKVSSQAKAMALGVALLMVLVGCGAKPAPQAPAAPTPSPAPGAAEAPAPPAAPAKTDPIKIAALTSFSGPFVVWGNNVRDGMLMAAEELNAAGGVNGRQIQIVERDDRNSPDEAVTALRGLAEKDGVVAAGGIISSGVGLAASREAEALQIPLFLTMSGSHSILTKESRYTFRTSLFAAQMNAPIIADMIKDRGFTRVGVISADYEWGHATNEAIQQHIGSIPGVQLQIETAPQPEKDFTTYLRRLQSMNPQILIALGHPPGVVAAAKQAIQMGVADLIIGAWTPIVSWMEGLGEAAYGKVIEFSSADFEDPAYQELANKFVTKYKTFFDNSAFSGYVIVKMVADAVARTGSDDPKVIAEAIHKNRFIQPGYAYPLSYTEWGELAEVSPVLHTFAAGDPGKMNPGANWKPEVVFRPGKVEPYVPKN